MVKLHNIPREKGRNKNRKRLGRGPSSGRGKTSGRGHGGQNSRSGGGVRPGFEGGQNPLHIRLPKLPGFKNKFRQEYSVVNVSDLNGFKAKSKITIEQLAEKGLIKKKEKPLKILGNGELDKELTVEAQAFSQSAKEKIEKAGGKAVVI